MATLTEILDDLRAAAEITRWFESVYSLSSADFYKLYQQGLLDSGELSEEFAMWAGFHEITVGRVRALHQLSEPSNDPPRNQELNYGEFAQEDHLLAEAGMAEYHAGLQTEDER